MNPTSRLEAEIDGLYATVEGLTKERDRGLARIAELEAENEAGGQRLKDVLKQAWRFKDRLIELERLAREVVDSHKDGASYANLVHAIQTLTAFLQPETPTPGIDAAMTCGNDLTNSVHETPGELLGTRKIEVAGTKGEGTIAVRKQHRVGCLTPEHYCPCPVVPMKPEPETKERTWRVEKMIFQQWRSVATVTAHTSERAIGRYEGTHFAMEREGTYRAVEVEEST